jgi:hypothetical protein
VVVVAAAVAACGNGPSTVINGSASTSSTNAGAGTTGQDTVIGSTSRPPSIDASTTTGPKGATTMPPPLPPDDPSLQRLVDLATADLAERLGIAASTISVTSAEAVVWPDAGLGCPQPGMAYIQVPVDGALVVLSAGGGEYSYHSGGRVTEPFLCEN